MQKLISNKSPIHSTLLTNWIPLIVCIVTFFSTSCTSLSKLGLQDYPKDQLTKNNYHELNGTYFSQNDTIRGELVHFPYDGYSEQERLQNFNILHQLLLSVPQSAFRGEDGQRIEPNEKWITIEFVSKNKAIISLYHNERFVFSKKIHGRFKKDYFYLRPKIWVMPLIPLVFGYDFERARLGKSGDYLTIDYRINMWGFVIAAGSSEKGYASSIYKKKGE